MRGRMPDQARHDPGVGAALVAVRRRKQRRSVLLGQAGEDVADSLSAVADVPADLRLGPGNGQAGERLPVGLPGEGMRRCPCVQLAGEVIVTEVLSAPKMVGS